MKEREKSFNIRVGVTFKNGKNYITCGTVLVHHKKRSSFEMSWKSV
jgi:hypothetical protein